MDKETRIILETKLVFLLELLSTLRKILAEYERNIKLKEYLLYAAEKKAEELVELAVSINQELLKEKGKFSVSYYERVSEKANDFQSLDESEPQSL